MKRFLLFLPLLFLLLPAPASAYNLHTPQCQSLQAMASDLFRERNTPASPEEKARDLEYLESLFREADSSVDELYEVEFVNLIANSNKALGKLYLRQEAVLHRAKSRIDRQRM